MTKIRNKLFSIIASALVTASATGFTGATAFAGFGQERIAKESELMQYVFSSTSAAIKDIAAGKRSNAIVEIKLPAGMRTNQNKLNVDTLLDALTAEFPYELYWFDVTEGILCSVNTYMIGNIEYFDSVRVKLSVIDNYEVNNIAYTVDTSKTSATTSAISTAKSIVNANKNANDYDKLNAYRKAICDLISYDYDAANHTNGQCYGDSWQLIYVFDGDPRTNVVCEGYAKAFQYLCDLTTFNDPTIKCSTVSGLFGEKGETGCPHMWNIVSVGGKSYLADLTNCDEGKCGADDYLFMKKASQSDATGCVFQLDVAGRPSKTLFYTYNDDTRNVLSDDFLTVVCGKNPTPTEPATPTKPSEPTTPVEPTNPVTPPSTIIVLDAHGHLLGDANGDGVVNAKDALAVLKHSAGLRVLIDELASDMNSDRRINAKDALIILKKSAGML